MGNAGLGGTEQTIYHWKVLMRAVQKCNLIEFEPLCQKLWAFVSNHPKQLTKYGHVT